jgi:putative restriction endonuclease
MQEPAARQAAFDWLAVQVEIHGHVLPWGVLQRGFELRGERIPLVSMQGIFTPKAFELPLSIRTSPGGPYDDLFTGEDLLLYRYRGTDPNHRDNVGLREAWRRDVPLVYLHGIVQGRYLAAWPVFIVGDDPAELTFTVAVDDERKALRLPAEYPLDSVVAEDSEARRRYVTSLVRRRLHQSSFRERVLQAYREQCALCRLKHFQLLDAAHIIPDREEGEPRVRNGVALCKLHHAAFDALFLTIRTDYRIEVRADILKESDGPMLIHGLQELHGRKIHAPRKPELRPDPEFLAQRYERFRAASTI